MKIYAYVDHYPSLYKPYYDTHFGNLLESGHELRIFSLPTLSHNASESYYEHGLDERTGRYNPDDLRRLPLFTRAVLRRLISHPRRSLRLWKRLRSYDLSLRERGKHFVRAATLPLRSPDLNLVHGHNTMRLFPWLRLQYPEAPVALFYHGGLPPEVGRVSDDTMRRVFQSTDIVFVPSRYARSEVVARGCDRSKVNVLPVAFDISSFTLPEGRSYRPNGVLRLISVGRLSRGKGHELTIRALARLRGERPELEFQLRIVGQGPRRNKVEAAIEEESLEDCVEMIGSLPFERVRGLFGQTDVMVLSSFSTESWTETQGAVIQEAMLMGNVVVTTSTGGVPESIPKCMEPFQVTPKDVEALARAIGNVADLSTEELEELGSRGRRYVEENYRIEDLNERLLATVRAWASERPRNADGTEA